jgi:hypothetical protein
MFSFLPNLITASISQPFKRFYPEKVNHLIMFYEIGQLAAGMTYMIKGDLL